ncbi:MAG: hypothetical protein K2J80_13980 [Oscillospiraceae bacterium]|nr:hypothetical protein [Oscillospiraceae bacterium]
MNAIENYWAGREHLDNAYYAEAIEFFKASVELERHFKPYECLYRCYAALNEPEKAFESISEAYGLNSKNDKVALGYAKMLADHKKDIAAAQSILSDILKRNPTYKPAQRLLNDLSNAN